MERVHVSSLFSTSTRKIFKILHPGNLNYFQTCPSVKSLTASTTCFPMRVLRSLDMYAPGIFNLNDTFSVSKEARQKRYPEMPEANLVAGKIWEAATDPSDRLRYLIGTCQNVGSAAGHTCHRKTVEVQHIAQCHDVIGPIQ